MRKQYFSPEWEGFYGVYYPNPVPSCKAMIAMLGDSSDDHMVKSSVKWLHKYGCNVMAMSPGKKDYGHHDYPLERIDGAIQFLKSQGNQKIGIVGASTTGMVALAAASLQPDLAGSAFALFALRLPPPTILAAGHGRFKNQRQ